MRVVPPPIKADPPPLGMRAIGKKDTVAALKPSLQRATAPERAKNRLRSCQTAVGSMCHHLLHVLRRSLDIDVLKIISIRMLQWTIVLCYYFILQHHLVVVLVAKFQRRRNNSRCISADTCPRL